MPDYVVSRVMKALNDVGKPHEGGKDFDSWSGLQGKCR